MIEQLFAQQGQARAFLMMLLGGVAVAAVAHGASLMGRRWRAMAVAGDVAVAAVLLAALMLPVVRMETPLRLYGLLGLALGAALYVAGIGPLVEALAALVKKSARRPLQKKENPPQRAKN